MNSTFAVLAVALAVAASPALGQEGGGDPFPQATAPLHARGTAYLAETGSEPYPALSGTRVFASSQDALEPAPGAEYPVQTTASLPVRWNQNARRARVLEAGASPPRG